MNRGEMRMNLRRGVYVIPTTLTVLNIFFGFTAILLSIRGMHSSMLGDPGEAANQFRLACWSLLVAAIFDTFDGLVARLMNATSEFGKEYDSLADVVTFGAAPAILVWAWALNVFPRLGGGIAFLFLVGGSLRLARFNIMTAKTDHRYFVGLPIPAAALTLAAIINYAPAPVRDRGFAAVMLAVVICLAFSMVSTVRYRSQKYASLQKERSGMYFLVFALVLALFFRWPAQFLFIAAITYVSSGPLIRLWTIAFPSKRAAAATAAGFDPDDTLP
ncbi:MAG TPA: CDP-diacylglycerol--serine O-phosphatidyltransferase [Thermoanaerobaculia bacterium]|nr:CDP-diacylglycerol--serine O-phosphatidyltransferase [Thermoanaerobaculia bacterium]